MTLIFGLASMTLMTACGGRSNDSSKPNPDNSKDSATSATTPVTPDTQVPEGYVDRINAIVKNKIIYCRGVMSCDFFGAVLKEPTPAA